MYFARKSFAQSTYIITSFLYIITKLYLRKYKTYYRNYRIAISS
jgi:hypothetical protein